jgi:hypothetical protein
MINPAILKVSPTANGTVCGAIFPNIDEVVMMAP